MGTPRSTGIPVNSDNRTHPPANFKNRASWLDGAEIINGTSGGSFRIVAHDNGPPGSVRAVRIVADDREYWVDMRRLWDEVPLLHYGVQIYYQDTPEDPDADLPNNWFVAGPIVRAQPFETPFQVGQVFTDTGRGVRITVDAIGLDPLAGNLPCAVS